jgi:uncharacterized membrane protein YuzA (DUF378 family)
MEVQMGKFNFLDWLAMVIMIIGALNWGLVGVFNFNIVEYIFGIGAVATKIVYIVVGLAALYGIAMLFKCFKGC